MNKLFLISKFTAKEVLKSKILYNILFLGIILFCVSYIAFQFTYGVPHRIALNFGLSAVNISGLIISLFFGANLVRSEIENRTLYMVLSRDVKRWQFLLGKVLGLFLVVMLNVLILSSLSLGIFIVYGGELSWIILWQVGLIFCVHLIVMLISILLSLVTNVVLNILLTVFIYFCGVAIYEVQTTTMVQARPGLLKLIKAYDYFLPGFYTFDIKDNVLYNLPVEVSTLFAKVGYGAAFIILLSFISVRIFNRKELT